MPRLHNLWEFAWKRGCHKLQENTDYVTQSKYFVRQPK